MERPRNATGDKNRPGDDRVLGHSIQVQNRDAAQDKPHRDDPVDVGKQPEVPEQPRAANDNQSNGQTGISPRPTPDPQIAESLIGPIKKYRNSKYYSQRC